MPVPKASRGVRGVEIDRDRLPVAGGHRRRDPLRVRRPPTPRYGLRNSSGSLPMFTAIRRSRVSYFAAVGRHSGRGGVRSPRIALRNKGRALAGCTPGAALGDPPQGLASATAGNLKFCFVLQLRFILDAIITGQPAD